MVPMSKCIQCPDGSWVCGSNPRCRPQRLIASLGRIQFDVELLENPGEDPPYAVRLKPVVVDS